MNSRYTNKISLFQLLCWDGEIRLTYFPKIIPGSETQMEWICKSKYDKFKLWEYWDPIETKDIPKYISKLPPRMWTRESSAGLWQLYETISSQIYLWFNNMEMDEVFGVQR